MSNEAIWGAGEFSKEAPAAERGKYIWQRTRQDNGQWQYVRVTTGSNEVSEYYFGIRSDAPSGNHIVGDSYVDSGDSYAIKVWNGTEWTTLSQSGLDNAIQSMVCAKAQKDVLSNIDPDTVTASDYGYFNNIIAGTITTDYIKALEGVFDSIHVSGNSQFDGQIVNDAMTTYPSETTTRSVKLYCESGPYAPYYWTDNNGNVLSGPLDPENPNNISLSPRVILNDYRTPVLSVAKLNAAFPQYGTYVAEAGTLTFATLSGTEYYSATPAMPITLVYQQNYFAILRNGEMLVSFGLYNTLTSETYHHLFCTTFPEYLVVSNRAFQNSGSLSYYGMFSTNYGEDYLQIGGYAGYAETTNIVPKTSNNYIGTASKPFGVVRANEIYGTTLGGTLNGNVVGNVTGDVNGNVNSSGTTNSVFGAVFN